MVNDKKQLFMIMVAGALHSDETFFLHQALDQGMKGDMMSIASWRKNIGGKGAAQALALHHLGSPSIFATAHGFDDVSEPLMTFLQNTGMSIISTKAPHTAKAVIMIDAAGRTMISIFPNDGPCVSDVPSHVWPQVEALVLQQEGNAQRRIKWIEKAASCAIPIVLNAAPCWHVMPQKSLNKVNTIIMNRVEAMDWGALDDIQGHEAQVARAVYEKYGCRTIITLGSAGSVGYDGRFLWRTQSLSYTVEDATGAGDVFVGAYTHMMTKGYAFEECLRFACYVAGKACHQRGQHPGLYPYSPQWAAPLTPENVQKNAPPTQKIAL